MPLHQDSVFYFSKLLLMDCFPDFFFIQFVVGMSESHAFCIWIMYLQLAESISSKNVLVQASVFLTYTIVLSANRNMLTPFSNPIPFVSFPFSYCSS